MEPEIELDLPAFSDVSLSVTGTEVSLATRYGAIVRSLDPPLSWSRVRGPELAISASHVSFGRHSDNRKQLAVASGRTVTIVDVGADSGAAEVGEAERMVGSVVRYLSADSRPVTALGWSRHSPHILATAANGYRFLIWDLRQRTHPLEAGPAQLPPQVLCSSTPWMSVVRWSPHDEWLLATGHEDAVHIWDRRKMSQSVETIASGEGHVLAVDWCQLSSQRILTVSAKLGQNSPSSGNINIWDLANTVRTPSSITTDDLPGSARFMPYGAVLAAVNQDLVLFPRLDGTEPHESIGRHSAVVSTLDFAPLGESHTELRLVCTSLVDRKLRTWRHQLTQERRMAMQRGRANTCGEPHTPTSGTQDDEDLFITESIKHQVSLLRGLQCVKDVVDLTYRQPGNKEHRIALTSFSGNRITFKMSIDHMAAMEYRLQAAAANLDGLEAEGPAMAPDSARRRSWGVRVEEELLRPTSEEARQALTRLKTELTSIPLRSLLGDGHEFCDAVRSFCDVLDRSQEDSPRGNSKADESERRLRPRTCGTCWTPQGDLWCFSGERESYQADNVLFLRSQPFAGYRDDRTAGTQWAWNSQDVLTHSQKSLRDRYRDGDEDVLTPWHPADSVHDSCVRHVPAAVFKNLVEDHWWNNAASLFTFLPSASQPMGDLCRHNSQEAERLGRGDLAEVWRVVAFLSDDVSTCDAATRRHSLPFAKNLVRQVVRDLFDIQDTLSIAMVCAVFRCLGRADAPSFTEERRSSFLSMSTEWDDSPRDQSAKGSVSWVSQKGPTEKVSSSSFGHLKEPSSFRSENRHPNRPRSVSTCVQQPLVDQKRSIRRATATWSGRTCPNIMSAVERSPLCSQPTAPTIIHGHDSDSEDVDLIPRDRKTLDCVIHSAHSQCDLLYRLKEWRAVRVLAKLLHELQAHHALPLLNAAGKYTDTGDNGPPSEAGTQVSGASSVIADLGANGNALGASSPTMSSCLTGPDPLTQPGMFYSSFGTSLPHSIQQKGSPAQAPRRGSFDSSASDIILPESAITTPSSVRGKSSFRLDFSGLALREKVVAVRHVSCVVCWERVRNLYMPCVACGHGYHLPCFRDWFNATDLKCPVIGCECRCFRPY